MSKKKLKNDGIFFCGNNADDVTGSQILIKHNGKQILLECGLYQSSKNSFLDAYRVNSAKFKFNANEIDYVFICHPHIDHIGLIPRLFKEGFEGKIILTKPTLIIAESLLNNCAFILNEEARILTKRFKRDYEPIYNKYDVNAILDYMYTYDDYNKIIKLDENVSFQWLPNSHCLGATQLQLILGENGTSKKILYTSDIGELKTKNNFMTNTEIPQMFSDYTIMESTYGNKLSKRKTRGFDKDNLKTAIETTINRNGTFILPAFSFNRSQELLGVLYDLFHKDKNFKTPIIVDSKLTCEICDLYDSILEKNNKRLWRKILNWDKINFIRTKEDSQICIADKRPKIIISSSGFCTNGRVVGYLEKYLQDRNSMICFSGYTGANTNFLSYKIKHSDEHKTININKKPIKNYADVITLGSFSSHAGFKDLIKYGSNLNTNKLILVHGSKEAKENLQKELKKEISKNNKSYKVNSCNKEMIINF